MVADIHLEIKGLKELNNLLNKLPDKIAKKPLQNALRAGGNVVVKAAKAKAPVDTGLLRDSISVRKSKEKTGAVHYQVGVYQKTGKKRPFYAHMIEFGTGAYYSGTGGKSLRAPYEIVPKKAGSLFFGGLFRESIIHPGIRPAPFMRPAVDNYTDAALDSVVNYMQKRIPKEMKKAGI